MELPAGLTLRSNYLDPDREAVLNRCLDAQPWRSDLKRRVQHYGWRYDYRARRVFDTDNLGPLPPWLQTEADHLAEQSFFETPPTQAIVNEYEPGQGIAPHIDCEPCFGETIASLSLGGRIVMDFRHIRTGERRSLLLEPGSLLVLNGPSRYEWTHGIAARKTDLINGVREPRTRRISITFRTVIV
ncbi:alpha-ketoglutarate-dependent dioxygenase AlkB [Notoacmeibacter marinus]|uniref:alpha-ketoglutarate-dependent dioxygenase AlkB n=1 Tax=Notoacmeibacter marinus TaxID=1876515 RepID=UPI000DF20291|nr:alpha-ketoglutarate-dependent dioxygenase AlkB [Notoacmeibacter marinus]